MGTARGARVVADIVRCHARAQPDALALVYQGRQASFAAFDRRINQVANGLIAAGLGPRARIAFLDKNSDRFFDLFLGAARANMVLVPVNWRLAPPEVAFIVTDAKAEALVIGREYLAMLDAIGDQLAGVKTILVVGDKSGGYADFDAWQAKQPDSDPAVAIAAADVAIQLYTSGTTGRPKGVELTNENLMAAVRMVDSGGLGPWGEDEINLVCLPTFHIGGTGWGLNGIYAGAASIVLREAQPDQILAAFRQWRVTKAGFVPAVLLALVQHPECARTDFTRLNLIGYGASPIPLDLMRQAIEMFKCGFLQLYGLTEVTGPAVGLPPEDHVATGSPRMRSCGKPLPGVAIRIVSPGGKDVAAGEVGEILIKGAIVMKGYWNLPDATAAAIVDGWFHSGDAGYRDADGYLYIFDRVKDMIVSGAENVYPAEVESALFGHPAIADVAVIGVPDAKWGEAVKAVVVLKPGASADAPGIIAFARERIAGFKCPKSIDFVEALPRNPSGKLLKRVIREPYWAGHDRRVN
jgi:acyl-CoA synthetase (AMP-forming)/AMP-acid ligase II